MWPQKNIKALQTMTVTAWTPETISPCPPLQTLPDALSLFELPAPPPATLPLLQGLCDSTGPTWIARLLTASQGPHLGHTCKVPFARFNHIFLVPETLTGSRWGQEACLPGHRWGTQGLLSPGRGMTPRRAAYTLHVADMRLEMHRQLFSLAGPCESAE